MPISLLCECGRQFWAKDGSAARTTTCPNCRRDLVIATPAEPAAAPEPIAPSTALNSGTGTLGEVAEDGGWGTSGKAVCSLVLGIAPVTCIPGLVGLILGILALRDVKRSHGRLGGRGMAAAGIVLGATGVMAWVLFGPWVFRPVVAMIWEANERARCMNNLKMLGGGMHAHVSAKGRFPAAAIVDKRGKPLLSWRVAILPYVGQNTLYREFHLDEPWDSPHNSRLLAQMPSIYACLGDKWSMTRYQVLVGPHTIFDRAEGTAISAITDGTSSTLLVCESATPVPWTKPDDIVVPPNLVPVGLGGAGRHSGGFGVLFADGSVRFYENSIPAGALRDLTTRDGGEVVNPAAY
jgi:prepilin-type processing-associated H-X9-DG protein